MSNDEKIVITSDECAQAEPICPESAWSSPISTTSGASDTRGRWKAPLLAVLITAFVFVILCMAAYCVLESGRGSKSRPKLSAQTIDQYKTDFVKQVDAQLGDTGHAWRKYVEDAHLTVTVSKAYVMDCQVKTIDGSMLAGKDGENISEINLKIRFFWDGWIDSGYTDLGISFDQRAGKVLAAKIIYTTALINVSDPDFWIGMAAILLAM